ncbi:sugar phosphate isomerase/epimerase family protein [Daejeonella sp. H1SJ63]|uniref:sugar phosphate isomerase/epimerase family protein n=1 Tax=Daejeonella sp. H1SJ63 TaxID=3034145 RepID=UPI0023EAD384|nr:sugar phosphate isomerase/epimerase family protein [Daejeonella sp. H1SJ63]
MSNHRRKFIHQLTGLAGVALIPSSLYSCAGGMQFHKGPNGADLKNSFFEISLAQWSLHKALFSKKIDNLDFPVITKKEFGINAVEYVNAFFKDKAKDTAYLNELLKRCNDNGVKNHLIMCDGEGYLGDLDSNKRLKAVDNHKKWVEAAKYLGCATIRVNAHGVGTADEVQKAAVEGLSLLGEYAAQEKINVVVENHGGYSSDGSWLTTVMKNVDHKNVGTLPDFNNFCLKRDSKNQCIEEYDRYKGTYEMLAYAKAVSAKSIDFDDSGNCVETDYLRMLKIVKDSGFKGYVGIEYEGEKLGEYEGIKKTKALLERVRETIG